MTLNKKNNRPENLRWITRLENILINPITLSRIIFKYGSIDNFLSDPGKPKDGEFDQNFEWMRTVTKEESKNTKKNLLKWAKSGKLTAGQALGDWIHSNLSQNQVPIPKENSLTESLTKNAVQKDWKTQSEFPNCPSSISENALEEYKEKLNKGAIFSMNTYGKSIVEESVINEANKELIVMTKNDGIKPYALAKVFLESNKFVHESIRTFFTLIGAQKQFSLALGLEWEGEDSVDDYS